MIHPWCRRHVPDRPDTDVTGVPPHKYPESPRCLSVSQHVGVRIVPPSIVPPSIVRPSIVLPSSVGLDLQPGRETIVHAMNISPSLPEPSTPNELDGLLTIGAFARQCGLTTSALRFYDDAGLLTPATVEVHSNYRRYHPDQLRRAVLLRRLREIDMPLVEVAAALADENAMVGAVDAHLRRVGERATAARRSGETLIAELSLPDAPRSSAVDVVVNRLRGPQLAAALAQVLSATSADPAVPILGGIHAEIFENTLTLAATDRYRLVRRTLPLRTSVVDRWQATLDGGDLRSLLPALRAHAVVQLVADQNATVATIDAPADETDSRIGTVRLLAEPFPDHIAMVDALPSVVARLTLPRRESLIAIEEASQDQLLLTFSESSIRLADEQLNGQIAFQSPGSLTAIWFAVTTLYPAIASTVGSDLLLDLRGPDQPATIRSADDGDLLTLVMPVAPGN